MTTNTLTNLIPSMYAELDVVSRELVGLIPAVTLDASLARGQIGQSIYSPVSPSSAASVTITPAMAIPVEADQVIGNVEFKLTKAKAQPFSWDGNEQRGLNTGAGAQSVLRGQFAQAVRALTNEIEEDLASLQSTFSRAYGTAGTAPFGTANDFTDASNVLRILKDNGAPLSDNQLVINTTAGASFLGKQGTYNTQGDSNILRQGVFSTLAGMDVRESGLIVTQTAGSFTAGTLTSAVRAKGATALVTTADYSAGLALGDIITLAHEGGINQYVVQSVSASAITIAAPIFRDCAADHGDKLPHEQDAIRGLFNAIYSLTV